VYIYANNKEHSDLIYNINGEKYFGLHPFFKNEITRIFSENTKLGPLDIYKILIKNKMTYDKEIPFPSRQQVRDFKYNTKKKHEFGTNELGTVIDYLYKYKFNDAMELNDVFEFDSEIKTGTDENHLFIFISAKKLINNFKENVASYHIDCTYKICERGFPMLVFGLAVKSGQFFPIAVSIISHEQTMDFVKFYQTLSKICTHLKIKPNVK
jgi:hypothetical protein